MNHPYMIKLEEYTEKGALSGKVSYIYKDNANDFDHAVNAYKAEVQTYTDEEGQTHETSLKKYKVIPYQLCYREIPDMAAWEAVNFIA